MPHNRGRTGIDRREFCALTGGLVVSFAFAGACQAAQPVRGGDGRLKARPLRNSTATPTGSHRLGLAEDRDAILHVPDTAARGARPLLVLLHGAGGSGDGILRRLRSFSDEAGVAVLAPDSRGGTWDAIRGSVGPDVAFLDRALTRVFDQIDVDPARVAVGGFSDGATYAISLGLLNGDLFTHVLAYSPGFFVGGVAQGRPRFFISHGTTDEILPIDRCSRVIVPALKKVEYDVTFRQFDGGHEIPPAIARAGMQWLVDKT
jgi:phospholipase/carboxylesterase